MSFVFFFPLVVEDEVVLDLYFFHDLPALVLKVASMLLEATQNCCPIEIILEQINLSLVRQIVAPRIKAIDIYAWRRYLVQVLIQTLLSGELAAIREMIVKLIPLQLLVNILTAIRILPLDIEKMATMPSILDPALHLSGTSQPFVLRPET